MPCHSIINNTDVEALFLMPQVHHVNLALSSCGNANIKECNIRLSDSSGMPMTDLLIALKYHRNAPLRSFSGNGKVAEHEYIYLKPQYRQKGIGANFVHNADNIYRRNEFAEIHLRATWDGIVVWHKKGFEYVSSNTEGTIVRAWRDYFNSVFSELDLMQRVGIIRQYKCLRDIPKKYLLPDNKQSFTDWLESKDVVLIDDMYKRIA